MNFNKAYQHETEVSQNNLTQQDQTYSPSQVSNVGGNGTPKLGQQGGQYSPTFNGRDKHAAPETILQNHQIDPANPGNLNQIYVNYLVQQAKLQRERERSYQQNDLPHFRGSSLDQ